MKEKFLNLILKLIEHPAIKLDNEKLYKLKNLILSYKVKLIYLVENQNWSTYWDGKYITTNLNKLKLIDAACSTNFLVKNKIIHWGTINLLLSSTKLVQVRSSNIKILTWFHIDPTDKRLKFIPILNNFIDILHTSSNITKKKLIELGFNKEKIVVIPLGIDLSHFKRFKKEKKNKLRKKFNLPTGKIIIGSFQKDGVGWGDGLEPKLIKGPDLFCEVVKRINENFDIHIFLTGPARGYVKKKLNEYKIPFTHIYLENYLDIVDCYNILDLYIVTSRAEGGPKAILEAMASGVPLITTRVGMVPEVIENGFNGLITEVDDINKIYLFAVEIIKNKELRNKIINNALITIQNYSWENIARQYYEVIYKRFLKYH